MKVCTECQNEYDEQGSHVCPRALASSVNVIPSGQTASNGAPSQPSQPSTSRALPTIRFAQPSPSNGGAPYSPQHRTSGQFPRVQRTPAEQAAAELTATQQAAAQAMAKPNADGRAAQPVTQPAADPVVAKPAAEPAITQPTAEPVVEELTAEQQVAAQRLEAQQAAAAQAASLQMEVQRAIAEQAAAAQQSAQNFGQAVSGSDTGDARAPSNDHTEPDPTTATQIPGAPVQWFPGPASTQGFAEPAAPAEYQLQGLSSEPAVQPAKPKGPTVNGIFTGGKSTQARPPMPAAPAPEPIATPPALGPGANYVHPSEQYQKQEEPPVPADPFAYSADFLADKPSSVAPNSVSPAPVSPAPVSPAPVSPAPVSPAPGAPAPAGYLQMGEGAAPEPVEPQFFDPDNDLLDEEMGEETLDMRFHVEKREDPYIGSVIAERYQIVSKVGSGGMGVVYKAQHLNIERLVAVKMLHPHMVAESDAIQRFKAEATAVSRVEHRHTVRIYEFGVSEQHAQPYIAMDFIDGISLREALNRDGVLSLARAGEIFAQVIDALGAAHEAAVVHRDLKPENIMLSETGASKDFVSVVDFGISTCATKNYYSDDVHDSNQQARQAVGSPPYMSPEQCGMNAEIDHRSDVYALAVVIYESLSGRLPFNGRTQSQFVEAHLNSAPIPFKTANESLSNFDALTEVFNKALEKKPERRYQSVAEFGNEFKEAIKRDSIRLNYLKNRKDLLQSSSSIPVLTDETDSGENAFFDDAQDAATQSQTGSRQKSITSYINCPHCNESVQRDVAFCLGCGRSLANPQELSKMRAVTGVFQLPKQTESLNGPVPTFSRKTRALNIERVQRKANKTLWIVSALLALSILFVAGGGEFLATTFAHLFHVGE